ncbi:MAG: cupredoxin family copper-binding protein [Chloroflexi bacterium]|nr:cupredoxin family copper-binding protein [Chloroflexota bacterium]
MLTASSSIGDNFFSPDSLSVPVGATVTWTNSGRFPHTVTSDAKLFDSGMLKPGQSFSFTFQALGEYRYYCLYHPGQTGMVLVSEEGVSQIPQSHTLSHDKHADKMENIVQGSQPLEMLADTKDSGQLSAIAPVATAATGKTNRLSDFVPQAWAATSILALAAGTVAAFLRARKSGQF